MTYKYELNRILLCQDEPVRVITASDVVKYATEKCYEPEKMWEEYAFMLFLDRQNRITGHAELSHGTPIATGINVKTVARYAVLNGAESIVLVHNHPGGRAVPSVSDKQATEKVRKALCLLGISLLDHVIIGEGEWYSFAEE